MRGRARPDILEARQHRRTDQIVVAEDRRVQRQMLRHMAQLPAVQQLALGQMDIGRAEAAEIDDLADAADDGARGQGHDAGRALSAADGVQTARPWRRPGRGVCA